MSDGIQSAAFHIPAGESGLFVTEPEVISIINTYFPNTIMQLTSISNIEELDKYILPVQHISTTPANKMLVSDFKDVILGHPSGNITGTGSMIIGGTGNAVSGDYSGIFVGESNTVTGHNSVIIGGNNNSVTGANSVIIGGRNNTTTDFASFVGGGQGNTSGGNFSAVISGQNNKSNSNSSFIGGGIENITSGEYSAIVGGYLNVTSGEYSAIVGGENNNVGSNNSAIVGGQNLTLTGAGYSHCMAIGKYNDVTGSDDIINPSHIAVTGATANIGTSMRFIIGNGTPTNHKNIFQVDSAGNVFLGGTGGATGLCVYHWTENNKYQAKAFTIQHPEKEEKWLVHGCLEGPEAGIYYRGKDTAPTTVSLPSYATKIATNFSVNVTPIGDPRPLAVTEVSEEGLFKVKGEGKFFWHAFGERIKLDTEPDKDSVVVNRLGPYTWLE